MTGSALALLSVTLTSCASSPAGTVCHTQLECQRGLVCHAGVCQTATLDLDDYTEEINQAGKLLLDELKARQLNVVTAESLTAGMIVSSLVNVPNYGAYVYGGFATYDSDAKRQFLGVRVGDVYTRECSLEMAIGALLHSRALVAVAVTGKAGPVDKGDLDSLGVVDVGVSIRTDQAAPGSDLPEDPSFPQTFTSLSRRIQLCDDDGHATTREVCDKYKAEAVADEKGYVSADVLALVRKLVRQDTVLKAAGIATAHLQAYYCEMVDQKVVCPYLGQVCAADYDGLYSTFGEPTWVIAQATGAVACQAQQE